MGSTVAEEFGEVGQVKSLQEIYRLTASHIMKKVEQVPGWKEKGSVANWL